MKNINIELPEYIKNIDGLRNLVRYQTAPKVSQETVAEHSFFVTAYILKLKDYYDFNLEKALRIAVLHDYAESFISDVPHPIKKKFPLISSELNKAEYEVNSSDISKNFADWVNEMNNLSSPEGCIVAFADILSVLSYAKYEIELGNSKYMIEVLVNAKNRVYQMIDKCSEYLKTDIYNNETIKTLINEFCD